MSEKIGVMFVGLCGHLSTTAMTGAIALAKNLCPPVGLISETTGFKGILFTDFSDFIFGGWDIRTCFDHWIAMKDTGLENPDDIRGISRAIEKIQAQMFPGIIMNAGDAISGLSESAHIYQSSSIDLLIKKVKEDINSFKSENSLDRVVVINLASTEPPLMDVSALSDIDAINRVLEKNKTDYIRPSFIYAYAAITSGCAYINFTPSEGGFSQGLVDLAQAHKVPVMGSDGKTGETLVKSALAPMFAIRNLEVLSWEGYNLLGNMDGKVLQNADNGASKIKSKDRLLPHILGYSPHSRVSIDYVPSLGDRKTAWDFIHFQGFLNTKMSLQFTWQGCDSALAAPLVLDLARFGILALEKGEAGVMTHMASFFKSPWGINEHSLEKQFDLLEEYKNSFLNH